MGAGLPHGYIGDFLKAIALIFGEQIISHSSDLVMVGPRCI